MNVAQHTKRCAPGQGLRVLEMENLPAWACVGESILACTIIVRASIFHPSARLDVTNLR